MITFLSRKYDEKQTTGHWSFFEGDNRVFDCKTLEPPDKDNHQKISCIPLGDYIVTKHTSPTYGLCLKFQNVINRTHILCHWGNYYTNTEGCILVGSSFFDINGDGLKDVVSSKRTFDTIMNTVPDEFMCIIRKG